MFSINIPIVSWILIGVELVVATLLLFVVIRPLRMVRKLPIYPDNPEASDTTDTPDLESEENNGDPGTVTDEVIEESDNSEDEPEEESQTIDEETICSDEIMDEEVGEVTVTESNQLTYPKVSVVVYSTVDEEILTEFLKSVCSQNYPDFEVIVVCDASFETSGILSEKYGELFKNVYVTFIPPGSHNLSRRKLALTLGIKAATGDVVLTTIANAVIPSNLWLTTMMAPFAINPETELSLGYSHPDYQEISGPGKYYKEFFGLLTDARWIGYAIMKKPFRGDGINLAMRRDTFFRCKGYSKTMHLHSGDDDLFVNDIADKFNTSVSIDPDSILTTKWGVGAKRIFSIRRSQYDFTARWLPLGPFIRSGLASLSQWLVLLTAVGAAITAIPTLIPLMAAALIWLVFMILETSAYRKAAAKLGATMLSWQVPLFWLIKPINNMCFRAVHRNSRFKNFTWQRHKTAK